MGKLLRIIAYILMGITAILTLLGAVGSVCISWWPEKYTRLAVIAPYKGVYQVATIFTFLAAFIGMSAFVGMIRGKKRAYNAAIGALLLGLATAGVKMYFSQRLRGSTMPTDIRFYLTIFTLLFFLLLRIPGIRDKVTPPAAGQDDVANTGAGIAMILAGALTLTTPLWAGPSHMLDGFNLVLVLNIPLILGGSALLAGGVRRLLRAPQRTGRATPPSLHKRKLAA